MQNLFRKLEVRERELREKWSEINFSFDLHEMKPRGGSDIFEGGEVMIKFYRTCCTSRDLLSLPFHVRGPLSTTKTVKKTIIIILKK